MVIKTPDAYVLRILGLYYNIIFLFGKPLGFLEGF